MFADAIEAILRDRCTPAAVRGVEAGGDARPLWAALADAGFLELLVPEDRGGAGQPLAELFPVLRLFGRHALPVPAAQAIVARAWTAGRDAPPGMPTLAPALHRLPGGGFACPLVPFGAIATQVLAADEAGWVLLDAAAGERESTGIPFDQAATLRWRDARAVLLSGDGGARPLESLGALLHAGLLAGAMERVFEMTLQYCNDRVQFGRSLGKFQAVQHQLAVMAEQVAAARIAAEAACRGPGLAPRFAAAAIAKARAGEAAMLVARHAHALHGAIGVTAEYELQLYTRRLHDWRMAHGAEAHWHRRLGETVLDGDAPAAEFARTAFDLDATPDETRIERAAHDPWKVRSHISHA
jgi:alkylation response protein AidB-like acyl-CoA dehydrogenase